MNGRMSSKSSGSSHAALTVRARSVRGDERLGDDYFEPLEQRSARFSLVVSRVSLPSACHLIAPLPSVKLRRYRSESPVSCPDRD